MVASCCTCMVWRIVPPRVSEVVLALCIWARVLVRAGLPCEAETCRALRRLVVRGGDLLWGSL
jgi:hypothetical protein